MAHLASFHTHPVSTQARSAMVKIKVTLWQKSLPNHLNWTRFVPNSLVLIVCSPFIGRSWGCNRELSSAVIVVSVQLDFFSWFLCMLECLKQCKCFCILETKNVSEFWWNCVGFWNKPIPVRQAHRLLLSYPLWLSLLKFAVCVVMLTLESLKGLHRKRLGLRLIKILVPVPSLDPKQIFAPDTEPKDQRRENKPESRSPASILENPE